MNYPVESTVQFSLESIAEGIVKQHPYIVSTTGSENICMSDLLPVEVYASLGENILQPLFSEGDPAHHTVICDRYISALCASWSKNPHLAIIISSVITKETKNTPQCSSSSSDLLAALKAWRDGSDGTYRSLRRVLDPLSVFAGRNPLVSSVFERELFV